MVCYIWCNLVIVETVWIWMRKPSIVYTALYFKSAGTSIFQHTPIKFDILYEAAQCVCVYEYVFLYGVN